MRRHVSLELAADPAGVDEAARRVVALLDRVAPDVAFACELAVAEACANIARHGFAGAVHGLVVQQVSDVRHHPALAGLDEPVFV